LSHFPLIALVGPTGSGKSDLGLVIADSLGGEIVNYDSVQVYRGFDIGSAKVPLAERRSVPHHLIDIADAMDEFTAGAYARAASQILAEISGRGRIAVLVGGTGFYLRALLDGLSPAPERDETLRERLGRVAARRPGALHRYLRLLDPAAAVRIHPNDGQKLIRAIEMSLLAGTPASATQSLPRRKLEGYSVLKIGLMPRRAQLYERLNRRSAAMFESGLLEETQALLQKGVPANAKPLQSLGYKQAVAVLNGAMSLEEAIEECQTRTRQYAKRQLTWFRADPDVQWLPGFGDDPAVRQEAMALVAAFLGC
jgi:tRNA dimethylallyltransferase